MKKAFVAAAALVALPVMAQAQTPSSGFYVGAEGGLNWLLNTTVTGQQVNNNGQQFQIGVAPQTGWAAGGKIGYDFVGPRVELEGVYRQNQTNLSANNFNTSNLGVVGNQIGQLGILANLLYDFMPGATITPYVGAGAGVGFVDGNSSLSSTVFAYQGIVGLAWNVDTNFAVSLDGRYYGTSNPTLNGVGWSNSNFSVMLGLTLKFGPAAPAAAPPPPPGPVAPSFMVFFDWDRSNLSAQALNTIKQAAGAYKSKGSARITATGHTDKSGPDSYNMALSLRRANTVKDALVREGVPATAISVIGKGETQPLVQTADGVREPQNRRVEIVIQ
jgi:opacity protein-like surface antigen